MDFFKLISKPCDGIVSLKMDVREPYDEWSKQYDFNKNKTRGLEAIALRETLAGCHFKHGLEVGCGTGKILHGCKMFVISF